MKKLTKEEAADLVRNSLTHIVGKSNTVELQQNIKQAVQYRLNEIVKSTTIDTYEVEAVEEDPETQLVREIMEQPKDTVELKIKMRLNHEISWISLSHYINHENKPEIK